MSTYVATFTAEREVAALVGVRAATAIVGTVVSRPVPDGRSKIEVRFEADDNYSARTAALVVQGNHETEARIRRDSMMFAGPWYDLNEEG